MIFVFILITGDVCCVCNYMLSDSVVMADTVNQFKHRLDKYWKDYDFMHDHRATYWNWRPILNVGNTCML